MAAIEKFVFEEEMVTLPQLVEILKNNWEGNQVLQMKMINEGAKFGNGQKSWQSGLRDGKLFCGTGRGIQQPVWRSYLFPVYRYIFLDCEHRKADRSPSADGRMSRIPLPLTCLRFCPGMYQAPWRL